VHPVTSTPVEESKVDAALFEGMFIRAIRPDAEFQAELRTAGFDPARLQGRYPTSVWRKSLEIARRRIFPDLPRDRGYRALGQKFVEGYFETIIGKVLSIPLKFMAVDHAIQRLPRMWKAGRPDLVLDPPAKEGPHKWRIHFHDRDPFPDFTAGMVEAASKRTSRGEEVNVDIENLDPAGYDLVLRW